MIICHVLRDKLDWVAMGVEEKGWMGKSREKAPTGEVGAWMLSETAPGGASTLGGAAR